MKHYIGIDFHLQHSFVTCMDGEGNIMDERKLYHTDKDNYLGYFSRFGKNASVCLEATRNWYWLVDALQELNLDVKLVHAKKARIIAESTIKTDKIDARVLAQLNRCNFLPTAYIATKQIRSARELLRYYMNMVKIRASVKNRIHSVLAKHNINHGFSDLFGKSGIKFLNDIALSHVFRLELDGYLDILKNINERIKDAQKEIKIKCNELPYVKHLMTIPGISYFSALLLSAEIADIHRFKTYKRLCCYAGLASTTHQSADKVYHGHIIKDSNKYIRYTLVEAVPIAIRKDPKLWSFYNSLQRTKGRQKAIIATARKLLISIYWMLINGADYKINNIYYAQVNPMAKLGVV